MPSQPARRITTRSRWSRAAIRSRRTMCASSTMREAISAIPGIRKGGVAAFGSPDPQTGTERLIVMAETKESNAEARAKLIAAAHEVVTGIAGSAADDIVLVPPRGVPKTSSGKVRRSSAKELYETGRTDVKGHGVWLQIARLALSSAGQSVTCF